MASLQSSFACLLLLFTLASCQVSEMSTDEAVKGEKDDSAHWYTFADKSYVFTDDMQTRKNATDICRNKYGGHLANLKTQAINMFLTSILRKSGYSKAWMGLIAAYECGKLVFRWTDGSVATYNQAIPPPWAWKAGCYYMDSSTYWFMGDCFPYWTNTNDADVFHYVCEVDGPKPNAVQARPKLI